MIQVNRIYLIFNRLVTKKFLVDTSEENNILKNLMLREIMTFSMIGSYVPDLQLTSCLKQLRNWKS